MFCKLQVGESLEKLRVNLTDLLPCHTGIAHTR